MKPSIPANTARLAARLRARGNDVTEIEYPSIGHMAIVGAFSPLLRPLAPVVNDVDEFVARPCQAAVTARAKAPCDDRL